VDQLRGGRKVAVSQRGQRLAAPATLSRSECGRGFVSDAGSGSGILRLRRKIPLLFGEENLKTVCFDLIYLKSTLKQERSACLRAF
jgi:hypothetical protein